MNRKNRSAYFGLCSFSLLALIAMAWLGPQACQAGGMDEGGGNKTNGKPSVKVSAATFPELTFHKKPKPLDKDARVENWPTRLGPYNNNISQERPLLKAWPSSGPTVVWEMETGSGFAAPVISGDRLVFFHRIGDSETVDCLEAETGKRIWRFQYPCNYEDRYGFNNGPRSGPVIDGDRVYTHGVEGVLNCLSLQTGEVLWSLQTSKKFSVPQDYFGVGSTPLIHGQLLVVNVGAPGGPTVVALDKMTGDVKWKAGTKWTAGYATPIAGTIKGKPQIFVFTGGDTDPPIGGLLSLDPTNGNIDFSFPFRSKNYISCNASSPTIFGEKVFISSAYKTGGVLLDPSQSGEDAVVWRSDGMRCHFMTPVLVDGYLYGVDGTSKSNTAIACMDISTGKSQWRKQLSWVDSVKTRGKTRELDLPFGDGSFIYADGHFIAHGEYGHLLLLELTSTGCKEISRFSPFVASETFTAPVLSHGLLYICQNTRGMVDKSPPRLFCLDFRG